MIYIRTSLTHNGRGRERHLSYFVKPPIQPASCRNSSLSATLAGRVNFAALLLCLVFVIVSHSHAPSAAFRLVLGSCVMRVPTRQSITSAKDLCIVRSVDWLRRANQFSSFRRSTGQVLRLVVCKRAIFFAKRPGFEPRPRDIYVCLAPSSPPPIRESGCAGLVSRGVWRSGAAYMVFTIVLDISGG